MRLQSDTADTIAWSKYATPPHHTTNPDNPVLQHAIARIHFSDAQTSVPLHAALRHAHTLRETSPRLLVVAGRSRRLANDHHGEMMRVLETYRPGVGLEGMRKTIGDVGTAMVVGGSASAVVVVQAADVAVG